MMRWTIPRKHPVLIVVVLAAMLSIPPGAVGEDPLVGEHCTPWDFISGTQMVLAPNGEHVRITFDVPEANDATIYAGIGVRASATVPAGVGYVAESAMSTRFVETEDGELLVAGGHSMYPYGFHTDVAAATLRFADVDGQCGVVATGGSLDLEPGRYVVTVFGATDTNGDAAAYLPLQYDIVDVEYGPSYRVSETEMTCDVKVHATTYISSTRHLEGCEAPYEIEHEAYRFLHVSRFTDDDHLARWIAPGGAVQDPVAIFDKGIGGAGTWTFDVPRYVTPLASGQTSLGPVPMPDHDSGIFGVIADVQR